MIPEKNKSNNIHINIFYGLLELFDSQKQAVVGVSLCMDVMKWKIMAAKVYMVSIHNLN